MKLNTGNIEKNLDKPIVLIGMMGSGKTHLGKMLAQSLNIPFYDSDQLVEARGGLSVNEIFELYGEERFRQSEEKTILELLNNEACIIATGGGAPVNSVILNAIKKQAISIWLKSDLKTIYKRIEQSKTRPLLKQDNPKQVLKELLDKREAVYTQADITIAINHNKADKSLAEMLEAIEQML